MRDILLRLIKELKLEEFETLEKTSNSVVIGRFRNDTVVEFVELRVFTNGVQIKAGIDFNFSVKKRNGYTYHVSLTQLNRIKNFQYLLKRQKYFALEDPSIIREQILGYIHIIDEFFPTIETIKTAYKTQNFPESIFNWELGSFNIALLLLLKSEDLTGSISLFKEFLTKMSEREKLLPHEEAKVELAEKIIEQREGDELSIIIENYFTSDI